MTSPGCVVCTRRWATVGCISTPRPGCCIPDSVATTVSTAFRGSDADIVGPHPAARRSAAVLEAARQAVADLVNGDPRGRGPRRRPRGPADLACRRVIVARRARLRGRRHPARRRGEHRAVAAGGQPLRRQGQVGRGRHRDRRAARVAVGEPDHPPTRLVAITLGVVDAGHRHRSAAGDQAGARRRRAGGGRSLRGGAVPADRHRRSRRRCGGAERGRPGAVRRSARWCSATRR